MQWAEGDLIEICNRLNADGVVFSANSVVLSNGELCLGAGAALRVKNAFPKAALVLGKQIKQDGYNWVQPDYYLVGCMFNIEKPFYVFALQVKRDFRHKGDLELTNQSLAELATWCEENPEIKLVMNCPLIGLGGYANQIEEIKATTELILNKTNVIVTIL